MVRQAVLRTKGPGDPSGVDANEFKRMLACKLFKQSFLRFCKAIATMTKILCTQCIDLMTTEPLTASLIPLDKGEGAARPIEVGEVITRIMNMCNGKCEMNVAKRDMVEACGSLQNCCVPGKSDDAVLLIDASNAFNALNRAAALHNIRVLCPMIAVYAINTYRQTARLFILGGREILSAEGTTQRDPLAMALYALSIQPLITISQAASTVKQCWFADDASGPGSTTEIKRLWGMLSTLGPDFGYFPNDKKCWIITRPDKEEDVKVVFKETDININSGWEKNIWAR